MSEIEDIERFVSFVHLVDLLPDTTYFFQVYTSGAQSAGGVYKFRTLPLEGELRFAMGGDLGDFDTVDKTITQAMIDEPYFIGFGGDIAYENGFTTCYYRYDNVLVRLTNNLFTPDG